MNEQLDTFLLRKPVLGRGVYVAQGAVVLGDVALGEHSSVWCNAVLRGDINRIVVGHHSNIQDNAVLHLADDLPCVLGDYVTVGHGAIVHACTIGDEVRVAPLTLDLTDKADHVRVKLPERTEWITIYPCK